jgi:CRP-like cAMP-binding protein
MKAAKYAIADSLQGSQEKWGFMIMGIAPRAHPSRLIAALPDAERERLLPYLEETNLTQGMTLVEAGHPIDCVWFPHDCVTSTLVETPEGSMIEVGLMGMEGLVGLSLLLGERISNTTVVVQIPGAASRMRASDFMEQVVEPRGELYRALMRYTDTFMAMIAQTAACNSLHPIEQRLTRWILMTHDRVKRDDMPLTQELLSLMLGVRRASVSVAASHLQDLGCIHYSRGRLRVTDREKLEQQSCPCYAIVRGMTERLFSEESAA